MVKGKIWIKHLDNLSDIEFINLIKELKINIHKIEFYEKIDGFNLRFGLDRNNNFFIQSSNSPMIFEYGKFIHYRTKINPTNDEFKIKIAKGYDEIFLSLKNNKKLIKILEKYNTNKGIKIICECLYKPNAIYEDNKKIKFLNIIYDKNKLKKITLFPFLVEDLEGNNLLNKNLFKELYSFSDNEIKFVSSKIKIPILLKLQIENFFKFINNYPNLEKHLKSNSEDSILIKKTIEIYRKKIKEFILKQNSKFAFDNVPEGFIISLGDKKIKVVSDEFKKRKKEYDKIYRRK